MIVKCIASLISHVRQNPTPTLWPQSLLQELPQPGAKPSLGHKGRLPGQGSGTLPDPELDNPPPEWSWYEVQQVKVLAIRPDDQSTVPKTDMVEEETP